MVYYPAKGENTGKTGNALGMKNEGVMHAVEKDNPRGSYGALFFVQKKANVHLFSDSPLSHDTHYDNYHKTTSYYHVITKDSRSSL